MLEVITPGSELYVTLAEFKAFAGITDATQDVYWTNQITSACEVISEYCGRPLCSEAVRETLRFSEPMRAIVLERWPVSATVTMTYGVNDVAVPAGVYEVDVRAGVVKGISTTGKYAVFDPGVWKLTYSGGYVTIPQGLKQAVYLLVKEVDALGKIVAGLKSRRIEGAVAESYFDPDKLKADMPPAVQMLLRRYVER